MRFPDRVNGNWFGTLDDAELLTAEKMLHREFSVLEREEKRIKGVRYNVLRGPDSLLTAWHRWSLANFAVRSRGLTPAYRP
jgi:hypothetical protein